VSRPSRLAVLGGGQLGRMLGLAAVPLGVDLRFLDPSPHAPARAVGPLVVGALGDPIALLETAQDATVVTYEWEGVPAAGAHTLEAEGATIRPSTRALEVSQDRLAEKTTFGELAIGVPAFAPVGDLDQLRDAVADIGLPAVLKTRRGGYDGKGQAVLRDLRDIEPSWEALGPAGALILEAWVPFTREVSVLAVRGVDGDTRCWPLVENHHEDGILRLSRPLVGGVDATVQARAEQYARSLLDHFAYVGVLALELFDTPEGLLANEMAPRVHNSGHWTIEGAATSQFENHVRAVLGWPLGATDARGASAMINCIGALPDPEAVLQVDGVHLHRYGKEPRPGRKVGHVTVTAPDPTTLDDRLGAVRALLPPDVG
jgi:5-(carboxyamino)imidazole ribonucleotide synthase